MVVREPVFIHTLEKQVLRILLIVDEMLLVSDDEVVYASCDRVVPIQNFHFKGAKRRVLFGNGSKDVAEIVIMRADVRDVVIKEDAASSGDKVLHGFSLSRSDPVDRVRINLW